MSRWVSCVLVVVAACASSRSGNGGDDANTGPNPCTTEGATQCMGSTFEKCVGGQWMPQMDCPIACSDSLGCVQCQPGSTFCQGGNVWMCDDTGNPGMQVQACPGATTCQNGACVDACMDAATSKSYIGCEYWAVDLDNAVEILDLAANTAPFGCDFFYAGSLTQTKSVCYKNTMGGLVAGLCDPPNNACPTGYTCSSQSVCLLDAQHSPFAIVVSNPQTKDAHVTVTGANGQTIMQTITAGQVVPILPQTSGVPDQSVDGTLHAKLAYKVVSDIPIVAYQFNPLDNVNVFSNDASLLIPRTAYDVDYYAMSWPTLDRRNPAPGTNPYYGYITIVAWQDNTQITVTPTAAVQASATQTTLAANAPANFTLNAFEVLQLEASGTGDLTGTHVVSANSTTFGVFGGHEATAFGESTPPDQNHPNGPCCADHLEEQLFPSSTWGKSFAIARTKQRTNEPDYIRVLAQTTGTMVSFTPAPSAMVAGNCSALDAGKFCDVKIQGDTEITSTQPILVGHLTESSIWADALNTTFVGNGDPSLAIAVPTEQYRTDYTILVPMAYTENYLSISAAATGGVTVDNAAVTLASFPGGGTHRAARVPVAAGQHTIHCADGCGVLVYGYSDAVSYMFAGGLDLKQIVIF